MAIRSTDERFRVYPLCSGRRVDKSLSFTLDNDMRAKSLPGQDSRMMRL